MARCLNVRLECVRKIRGLAPGLVALFVASGCLPTATVQDPTGNEVVQILLRTDRATQFANISDVRTAGQLVTVDAALSIAGPTWNALLSPSGPGQWSATAPVAPSEEVYLSGTLAGRTVSGHLRMPTAITIVKPRLADTLRLGTSGPFSSMTVEVSSNGAAGFVIEQIGPSGAALRSSFLPTGIGAIGVVAGLDHIARFRVYALEQNAWRFAHSFEAGSSLNGALGYIGGATVDSFGVVLIP